MTVQDDSTIYALASASGRAGVSVVRVSGAQAAQIFTNLSRPATLPPPRQAVLRPLIAPVSGELLDKALLLWFPAPHSFTGEDVVELHLHGGRAVLAGVIDTLSDLPHFRQAEAGEFSRRAFENGKMDLTEAEAIADLVDAETACQRRQALRQMDGALAQLYDAWAGKLKIALAHGEALIDFVEEEDIPLDLWEKVKTTLAALHTEIASHLNDNRRGERLREGFVIAILGAPNAGKSSLLNALAEREVAIVTPTPGTTRDVIEVQLDLGGLPVTMADTAGLRETVCTIESEGIRRALHRAEQADLKLLVYDSTKWPQKDPQTEKLEDDNTLILVNKCDLSPNLLSLSSMHGAHEKIYPIAAKTGQGLKELTTAIMQILNDRYVSTQTPSLTRARHREALKQCIENLDRAMQGTDITLVVEDIRLAMRSLGRITGHVDVEDLLDIIFGSFCIGK